MQRLAGLVFLLALGVSPVNGQKIYWTDTVAQKIQRSNLNGSLVENVHVSTLALRGLAIDPFSKKMYWGRSGPGAIERANLDGSGF